MFTKLDFVDEVIFPKDHGKQKKLKVTERVQQRPEPIIQKTEQDEESSGSEEEMVAEQYFSKDKYELENLN